MRARACRWYFAKCRWRHRQQQQRDNFIQTFRVCVCVLVVDIFTKRYDNCQCIYSFYPWDSDLRLLSTIRRSDCNDVSLRYERIRICMDCAVGCNINDKSAYDRNEIHQLPVWTFVMAKYGVRLLHGRNERIMWLIRHAREAFPCPSVGCVRNPKLIQIGCTKQQQSWN